jgi:uncharacterized phage protein (TIGR01671 family)
MTREIKFRAWDPILKKVHQDIEHHFGFKGEKLDNEAVYSFNDLITRTQVHFTLMQFTGLHDKSGREIYEGDIVTYERLDADALAQDVVKFEGGSFICGGSALGDLATAELVIIGNEHENPDLLTSTT